MNALSNRPVNACSDWTSNLANVKIALGRDKEVEWH
jgi:hypothetical protein